MKSLFIISIVLLLASCSLLKKKQATDKDAIARVNDEYLYASDIKALTRGLKGKDSVDVLKNYAVEWVRKKLLLQKAVDNIPEDDIGITKKVEEYRQSLLLYEYEKALINQKLDTVVKAEEMRDWYEKMKNDFPLENDVYLLFFIKLKKDAPDLDKARKWIIKPKDEEDQQKMEGYCKAYATSYETDRGMWYERENIMKNFPLNEGDITSLSNSKNFREFKTDDGTWFIKIPEMLKKNEAAPLPFIQNQLMRAIMEKRRMQLIERVYDKIYTDGLQSKAGEILVQ